VESGVFNFSTILGLEKKKEVCTVVVNGFFC
jgi:hypothetical protein